MQHSLAACFVMKGIHHGAISFPTTLSALCHDKFYNRQKGSGRLFIFLFLIIVGTTMHNPEQYSYILQAACLQCRVE